MSTGLRAAWWGALLLLLLLAPLPLGAVNTQWSMLLAAACFLLGGTRLVALPLLEGRRVTLPRTLIPFVCLVVWFGVQLLSLPEGVIGFLSPERLTFPAPPGGEAHPALTLAPGATLESGLLHMGLLYLLWALALTPSRVTFRILAVAGFLHAALALVLVQVGGTGTDRTMSWVLWWYEKEEVLTPFGSYWNKNHFAGFMLIAGGGCLAVIFRRFSHALRGTEGLGLGPRLGSLTGRGFFRLLVPMLGFLVITLALWESGSVGGVAAAFAALAAVFLAIGWRMLSLGARIALLALALVAGIGAGTMVVNRLRDSDKAVHRPGLWKNTLEMAERYPVAGTGLGSFKYVFPRYQRIHPDRRFSHAEGDWIQYLAETGLVGALALAALALGLARASVRVFRRGGSPAALAAGALVGVLAVVLHGLIDTSLHVPANLFAASVLLGGLLGIAGRSSGSLEGAHA